MEIRAVLLLGSIVNKAPECLDQLTRIMVQRRALLTDVLRIKEKRIGDHMALIRIWTSTSCWETVGVAYEKGRWHQRS